MRTQRFSIIAGQRCTQRYIVQYHPIIEHRIGRLLGRLAVSTEHPLMPVSGHYLGPGMIVLMTEWQLHVSLTELRRSIDLLMEHLAAAIDGETIRLDRDYFWSIGEDELYEVYSTPSDLTLGQLSWSWGHLTDLLSDPDGAIGYHLVWLSEVLRAIGHKVP